MVLILIHALSPNAHAVECRLSSYDKGTVYVKQIDSGEKAPCDGFFFSNNAERDASEAREDVKYFNKLVPKLEERILKEQTVNTILEKRLGLYIKQSNILALDRVKSDNRVFLERMGMFILGMGAVYVGNRVTR